MSSLPRRLAVVLALAAGLVSCGDGSGPTDAGPSALRVEYVGDGSTDGAILLWLQGPGIGAVAAADTVRQQLLSRPVEGGVRAAVFGRLEGGDVLTFTVPEGRGADDYRATLLQVSGTDGRLRASPAGRSLRVRR